MAGRETKGLDGERPDPLCFNGDDEDFPFNMIHTMIAGAAKALYWSALVIMGLVFVSSAFHMVKSREGRACGPHAVWTAVGEDPAVLPDLSCEHQ